MVTDALAEAVERAFDTKVTFAYGLTEAAGPLQPPGDGPTVARGSVGVPAPEGELWGRNPAVTLGYLDRTEETAARLVDGWLRTGDRFRKDGDGFFHFVGRNDEMFDCGGENLHPKEVEDLIARHPEVAEVAVAPIPHLEKGQAPAALVVARAGADLDAEAVPRFCLAHGPASAHPRKVLRVDPLPMFGTGKPDHRAVRARLTARA